MPKRNRQTLKERYKPGYRPSSEDMWDLIDSSVNILDDGFSKQAETGMALAPMEGRNSVLSVFKEAGDDLPEWQMEINRETGDLCIGNPSGDEFVPSITLKRGGGTELKKGLAVKGILEAPGRKGTFVEGKVPANGYWHDIAGRLEGCWALEVIAGCGRKNSGKHALVVATAVHCFGARRRISRTSSCYGMSGNRICLKWKKDGTACRLYMKTRFNYGDGIMIRYNISRLWDSPFMEIV